MDKVYILVCIYYCYNIIKKIDTELRQMTQETSFEYLGDGKYKVITTISEEIMYYDIKNKQSEAESYIEKYGNSAKIKDNLKAILDHNKRLIKTNVDLAKKELDKFSKMGLDKAEHDFKQSQKEMISEDN